MPAPSRRGQRGGASCAREPARRGCHRHATLPCPKALSVAQSLPPHKRVTLAASQRWLPFPHTTTCWGRRAPKGGIHRTHADPISGMGWRQRKAASVDRACEHSPLGDLVPSRVRYCPLPSWLTPRNLPVPQSFTSLCLKKCKIVHMAHHEVLSPLKLPCPHNKTHHLTTCPPLNPQKKASRCTLKVNGFRICHTREESKFLSQRPPTEYTLFPYAQI